ncbi:hypothetical protein BH23PLA1_BH23PLA1_19130 [soil metagenome]
MSEDRPKEPSPRRRQQAREQGQVARSGELTAAVGLLATATALGIWGADLAAGLVEAIRMSWLGEPVLVIDPNEVVERARGVVLGVAVPLLAILGVTVVAVLVAHLAQVGPFWVPGLLVPDPGRLWKLGRGEAADSWGQGAWGLFRIVAILSAAAWAIRAYGPELAGLGLLDSAGLSRGVGVVLRGMLFRIALVLLVLGLIDLAWQHRRFEARLRATPEQDREDRRAAEGDPALRSQRRSVAEGWRRDPVEPSAGPRAI